MEGPWWKSVVKDPSDLSRGREPPHLDVAPGGHTPVSAPMDTPHCTRSFVCELGLTLRRSDPLKTTSILLLGSNFSAKTEGYGKEKLKDF